MPDPQDDVRPGGGTGLPDHEAGQPQPGQRGTGRAAGRGLRGRLGEAVRQLAVLQGGGHQPEAEDGAGTEGDAGADAGGADGADGGGGDGGGAGD